MGNGITTPRAGPSAAWKVLIFMTPRVGRWDGLTGTACSTRRDVPWDGWMVSVCSAHLAHRWAALKEIGSMMHPVDPSAVRMDSDACKSSCTSSFSCHDFSPSVQNLAVPVTAGPVVLHSECSNHRPAIGGSWTAVGHPRNDHWSSQALRRCHGISQSSRTRRRRGDL